MFCCLRRKPTRKAPQNHPNAQPPLMPDVDYDATMEEDNDVDHKIHHPIAPSKFLPFVAAHQPQQQLPAVSKLEQCQLKRIVSQAMTSRSRVQFHSFEEYCKNLVVEEVPESLQVYQFLPLEEDNQENLEEEVLIPSQNKRKSQILDQISIEIQNTTVQEEPLQIPGVVPSSLVSPSQLSTKLSAHLIEGRLEEALRLFAGMSKQQKNTADLKGYPPALLVTLLAIRNSKYLQTAKSMLYSPELKIKCKGPMGWTPLQEAIFYKQIPLVVHIFRASYIKKREELLNNKLPKFMELLHRLPNFSFDIEVRCKSFLPLVEQLAPSDTLKIRKWGNRIRMDSTLAGYESLKCKRRDLSLVFNPQGVASGSAFPLFLVNRTKGTYTNVLEQLDEEEMLLIIHDLLQAECINSDPKISEVQLQRSCNLFGTPIMDNIGGYQCPKYSLEIKYQSRTEKRRAKDTKYCYSSLNFLDSWPSYLKEVVQEETRKKRKKKDSELELWLCDEFPLEFKSLLQLLRTLGVGNQLLQRFASFFESEGVEKLMTSFPAKIQIPLNYTIYLDVQFTRYSVCTQAPTDFFCIPKDVSYCSRKISQKTTERQAKRLLLANMYL